MMNVHIGRYLCEEEQSLDPHFPAHMSPITGRELIQRRNRFLISFYVTCTAYPHFIIRLQGARFGN